MTYAENIVAVFNDATPAEYDEGMRWYGDQYRHAIALSPDDVWRGAGIIAVYSPNNHWDRNIAMATQTLLTGTVRTDYFPNQVEKAQRILDGEFALDVLTGDKERAFCAAIATNGESDIATIDRHAHDIAQGRVFTDNERKIGKRLFRTMVMHYQQAAMEVGIATAQIQAVTWVTWRNRKVAKS